MNTEKYWVVEWNPNWVKPFHVHTLKEALRDNIGCFDEYVNSLKKGKKGSFNGWIPVGIFNSFKEGLDYSAGLHMIWDNLKEAKDK